MQTFEVYLNIGLENPLQLCTGDATITSPTQRKVLKTVRVVAIHATTRHTENGINIVHDEVSNRNDNCMNITSAYEVLKREEK